jgi:hypothetical protein
VREKVNLLRNVSLLKTGNLEVGEFVKGIKIMRALNRWVVKIKVAEDH